jgi:hypothetical protein
MRTQKKTGLRQSGRFATLQDVVGRLNEAPTLPGALGVAWTAAGEILGLLVPDPSREQAPARFPSILGGLQPWRIRRHGVLPGLAVRKFNALARTAPVHLALVTKRVNGAIQIEISLQADDVMARVLRQLWQTVFQEDRLDRLKRCDRCARWFVDEGDNRRARFCGPECEQRWWTRPRRRLVREGRARKRRPVRQRD